MWLIFWIIFLIPREKPKDGTAEQNLSGRAEQGQTYVSY